MSITAKSLADGQLPSSKGTLYTVPAATKAYIKFFSLHNTSATPQTVKVYIKRSGGTSRQVDMGQLDQGETGLIVETGSWELSTGDIIEGETTTVAVVDYQILGAEEA